MASLARHLLVPIAVSASMSHALTVEAHTRMSDTPTGVETETADDGEFFYESEQIAGVPNSLRADYDVVPTTVPRQSANASFSPNQLQKDACLIMYHIPKCGGTSLHRFFNDNGLKLWTHYGTLDPNSPPPYSDRGYAGSFLSADVYMGHWTPDFKQILRDKFGMNRNCYEATVLRTPYERVASALFFHHPGYSQDQLVGLMKQGPVRETIEYYNDECRRFGGADNVWDTYSQAYKNDNMAKASCNASAAVRRISELDFVFSTSDYRGILGTLGTLFGLKDIKLPPIMNASPNPGFNQLLSELQRLISAGNERDMEVFASASDSTRAAPSGAPRTPDLDTVA
jgi:hypothetical protein